ncbi:MAG: leucyl aminopeptidase [bacterium]|nr:leucyl aminopeptidase [bacterium]
MKINNQGNFENVKNRVIIVSEGMDDSGFSENEKVWISRFQKQDKDLVSVNDLDAEVILVKRKDSAEKMRMLGASVRSTVSKDVASIAISGGAEDSFHLSEGLLLANYQFLKYFKKETREKKENKLNTLELSSEVSNAACEELKHIYQAVSWARTMVNEPVSFLTAEQLAEEMKEIAEDANITATVLEKTQLESLKMGGILAVNKGSIDPPTLTILDYKPKNAKNKKPIVLVGKGVVYDTGGLSLKPTPNSMDSMKSDMGGAACVAGAIYLAAKQQLPLHIMAVVPATDNRPGLNAYAPGDVIKMFNGLTVEVLNTDAEGRMILADALAYSNKFQPELVVDAATLTGAAFRAVGEHASCIMGNADEKYFDQLAAAGEASYERTVRFPFWDEYGDEMKSPIADLKNLGGPTAGMITAGKFLENFVEAPYIHMDIAGPAWRTSDSGYRTKGGTGAGVRLLYHFLKNYK